MRCFGWHLQEDFFLSMSKRFESTSLWPYVVTDSVLTELRLHQLREHNLIDAFFMPQEIAVAEQMPYKGRSEV